MLSRVIIGLFLLALLRLMCCPFKKAVCIYSRGPHPSITSLVPATGLIAATGSIKIIYLITFMTVITHVGVACLPCVRYTYKDGISTLLIIHWQIINNSAFLIFFIPFRCLYGANGSAVKFKYLTNISFYVNNISLAPNQECWIIKLLTKRLTKFFLETRTA